METWGRLTTIIISNSAVQPWRQWFIAFAQMIIIHFQVTLGYTAYDPSKSSFQMQSTVVIRPTLQVTRHGQLWREEFWPKSRVPQRNEDRDIPSKKNFPTSCQNREDFCSEEMIFWKCHLSHVDLKSSPSLHKGHLSHGMKSTVPFRSIRAAPWSVTHRPKFCFRSPPKLGVTNHPNRAAGPKNCLIWVMNHQEFSVAHQNDRDYRDFSWNQKGPWCVTPELIEMVQ